MSRGSVRIGVATLLASLQNQDSSVMFKAVYPVMPKRVDKRLTPAAFVMLPRHSRKRYGPNQKHADYVAQARILFSGPSTNWASPPSGNLWTAPANDPQVLFDTWLDALARTLEANKNFPQDTPEAGVQVIQIGEPEIDIVTGEPAVEDELIVMFALVSFPVAEQILGV